jgi:hypothetical protein
MPVTSSFLRQRLEFSFPAAEAHSGIPLSNGNFGALLWGDGRRLRLTLNRADYSIHRSEPPTHPPMGRLDLVLPLDWAPASGGLHLATGEAELELEGYREHGKLRTTLLRDRDVVCLRITGIPGADVKLESRPPDAPEVVDWLRSHGLPKPECFDLGEFGGWVQECPGEPALCVSWLRHVSAGGLLLFVTAVYGPGPAEARKHALQSLEAVSAEGYTPATLRSFSAWRKWWEKAPPAEHADPKSRLLGQLQRYRLAEPCAPEEPNARIPDDGADYQLAAAGSGADELALLRNGAAVGTFTLVPRCLEGTAASGHKREPRAYKSPFE